jgi:hypothetical protein
MSTGAIIGIVIAVVVVLVLGAMVLRLTVQQRELRSRFGPEYDRVMEDQANRRAAMRELSERERRHAELDLQPITATSRDRYRQSWALIQSQFVDRPSSAVDEADRLVLSIMEERGYPIGDIDERLSLLSVDHASVLGHYREAYDIRERHQQSQVSTEELRTAMVHYRWLVEDLLEVKPTLSRPKRPAAPAPAAIPAVLTGTGDGQAIHPEKVIKRDGAIEEKAPDTAEDTVDRDVRDGKVDEVRDEKVEAQPTDERRSSNSSRSVDA